MLATPANFLFLFMAILPVLFVLSLAIQLAPNEVSKKIKNGATIPNAAKKPQTLAMPQTILDSEEVFVSKVETMEQFP